MNNNHWASIAYIPPVFLVLLFGKRAELIRFHAKQAVATWLVFALALLVSLIPGNFFAIIKWPISLTAYGLFASYIISGIIYAWKGQYKPLPLLGELINFIELRIQHNAPK